MDELSFINPNPTQEHQYQLACLFDPNMNIGSNSSASSMIISTNNKTSPFSFSSKIKNNNNTMNSSNQPVINMSRYERQKRRDWNTFKQYLRNHYYYQPDQPPPAAPLSSASSLTTLCSGAHVIEFLRYLDQFGKTKVHNTTCPYFGCSPTNSRKQCHQHPLRRPPPPPTTSSSSSLANCPCPNRQAWGSLDALVGRLRAAFDEEMKNINRSYGRERGRGRRKENNIEDGMINIFIINNNPFGARSVRLYLRQVKDYQSKARGVSYEKKKKKKIN